MPESETAVAAEISEAQRQWWISAVEAHLPAMYRFVSVRVPRGAADDLVQDVFTAAASSLAAYDPGKGTFWQWLLGIARNNIAAYYRRCGAEDRLTEALRVCRQDVQPVLEALASESPLPEEVCHRREVTLLVRAAMSSLEPRHQQALLSRYHWDLPLRDIGKTMGLSPAAVNSLLYRAREELRNALTALAGDPSNWETFT